MTFYVTVICNLLSLDLTQVMVDKEVLLRWFREQVKDYSGIRVNDLYRSFRNGLVLCTVIHRYNPELM